ncbi:MAG: hypothetical protein Q7T11_00775 [Deltaproteobacteria bacterium]|nr:hypothetical protein [Deltaproteobacteria bacterium]
MRKLKIGIVADPIDCFDSKAETTFFLMREAADRGHETWIMELKDLALGEKGPWASAKRVVVTQKMGIFSWEVVDEKEISISKFDAVFLRKDPPVDLEYLHHLMILEKIPPDPPFSKGGTGENSLMNYPPLKKGGRGDLTGPLFINSPSGILRANEKIFPLQFPGLSPPTLVSMDRTKLTAFIRLHKKTVIKPLHLSGGRGIFIAKGSIQPPRHYVMAQKFIPEAVKGDKRILLLDGKPLGAFLRIPAKGNFRGNLHQGAKWVKALVTPHEKRIIQRLKPALRAHGLPFVGLDLLGKFVSEINTTSPMGIREINQLDHSQIEKNCLNWLESRVL